MLTTSQTKRYHDEGFLVLPGFRGAADVAALRQRADELVAAFDPREGAAIFTTKAQAGQSDAYFLASAERIACFYEEEAFGPDGALRQPLARSINKIGHALHDLDPVVDRFSRGADMAALAADLGIVQPQAWQSMLIFKQPGIGGEVGWHQDASFLITEPITVTTFWFALEDASLANGCLWVQPGGHRGPLRKRFVREGDAVRLETLDETPWPTTAEAVPVEVEAGTLVVFHGLLPHYSAPNRSTVSRLAYTLHVVDGRAQWSAQNWLRRSAALPLRGLD